MIPVRVPADAPTYTVGGVRSVTEPHPLAGAPCPVCDNRLDDEPVTLVYVGVLPEDRKEQGWMTGAAVAVHATCASLA